MQIEIRKAAIEDAEAIAEVQSRSWEAAYAGIVPAETIARKNAGRRERWRKNLSAPSRFTTWAAVLEGRVVGFMSLALPEDEDLDERYYELCAIYLHPDVFRRGMGRRMAEYAFDLAREAGKSRMAVYVLEANAAARGFYEACGFRPDGKVAEAAVGTTLRYIREV